MASFSSSSSSSFIPISSAVSHKIISSNNNIILHENKKKYYNNSTSPIKLKNLGNTCYLNAALQVLANCYIFSNRISDINDIDGILPARPFPSREDRTVDLKRRLVNEIERAIHIIVNTNEEKLSNMKFDTLEIAKDDKEVFFSPYKLRLLFARLFSHFRGSKQQDAHEFLIHILNVIHEMTLAPIPSKIKNNNSQHVIFENNHNSQRINKRKKNKKRRYNNNYMYTEESFVNDTFGGLKQCNILCKECNHLSITYESFLTGLTVELPDDDCDNNNNNNNNNNDKKTNGTYHYEDKKKIPKKDIHRDREKIDNATSSWWTWSFFSTFSANNDNGNIDNNDNTMARENDNQDINNLTTIVEEKRPDSIVENKEDQKMLRGNELQETRSKNDVTLINCLKKTFSMELLSGVNDLYHCNNCHKHVEATKTISIKETPETLILHLKRFKYNSLNESVKISTNIDYPLYDLNLKELLTSTYGNNNSNNMDNEKSAVYDLIGLIEHQGSSCKRGHYIAFVRREMEHHSNIIPSSIRSDNTNNNDDLYEWYKCDDNKITLVSDVEDILDRQAYILIYTKRKPSDLKRMKCIEALQVEVSSLLLGNNSYKNNNNNMNASISSSSLHINSRLQSSLYVSKYWLKKLRTSYHPGPINNFRFLCRHSNCYQRYVDKFVPIPKCTYARMAKLFGEFDGRIQNHTTISDKCKECESEKEIWERKRDLDREFFRMILENENVNEDVIGPNDKWYIIDADWLSHWKAFLFDDSGSNSFSRILRYRWGFNGYSGYPPPPPISNETLLLEDLKTPKLKLKKIIHYRGVNKKIFTYLKQRYGGGPVIIRDTLDIYDHA